MSNDNNKLSHYDDAGRASMVDVSAKQDTKRTARAHAFVRLSAEVLAALPDNPKGDPLETARIAGIMAAKRTADLIPLCHPLPLTRVAVAFAFDSRTPAVEIEVTAETLGRTGVEMEALAGAAVGLLAIYDMCKAADRGMRIEAVRLAEKRGGRSGHYLAP